MVKMMVDWWCLMTFEWYWNVMLIEGIRFVAAACFFFTTFLKRCTSYLPQSTISEKKASHPVRCPTSTGQLILSVVGSARVISSQPFSTTICIAKVEHNQPMQSMLMTMHLRWSIDNHIQTVDHDWPSLIIIWWIHLTKWIVPVAIVSYYPWWNPSVITMNNCQLSLTLIVSCDPWQHQIIDLNLHHHWSMVANHSNHSPPATISDPLAASVEPLSRSMPGRFSSGRFCVLAFFICRPLMPEAL